MTKKKRRRTRTRPKGTTLGRPIETAGEAELSVEEMQPKEAGVVEEESPAGFREATPVKVAEPAETEEKERRRGLFGGLRQQAQQSPYPPLGVSLARGIIAVGSSPSILVGAFLFMCVTWGLFAALGTEPSPRFIAILMSLAPVHVFFDANAVLVASTDAGSLAVIGMVLGTALLRAATFGLLALLIVGVLRAEKGGLRASIRSLPRVAAVLWAVYAAQVGVVLVIPFLLQGLGGSGLGSLAIPLVLVFGLHFLVMAPAIAAAERSSPRETLLRSVRAARLPGIRHFALAGTYFAFILWTFAITPASAATSVTPSLGVWVLTLLFTFVHVGVLGAFVFRWLAVREEVPSGPAPKRREREPAS